MLYYNFTTRHNNIHSSSVVKTGNVVSKGTFAFIAPSVFGSHLLNRQTSVVINVTVENRFRLDKNQTEIVKITSLFHFIWLSHEEITLYSIL